MALPNFSTLLYAPLYAAFAVDAQIAPSTTGTWAEIRAIDKTKGVEISPSAELNTIRPAAEIRVPELLDIGISRTDLRRGHLLMNARLWRIEDFIAKPAPTGEDDGELRLFLIQVATTYESCAIGSALGSGVILGVGESA